jgi:hypothetical protein
MTVARVLRQAGFSEVDRRRLVRKLWAGYGTGNRCDYCSRPITAADVEFEVELASGVFRFHRACQSLWESAGQDGGKNCF